MATSNLSTGVPLLKSDSTRAADCLASCRTVSAAFGPEAKSRGMCLQSKLITLVRCLRISEQGEVASDNDSLDTVRLFSSCFVCFSDAYFEACSWLMLTLLSVSFWRYTGSCTGMELWIL